MASAFNYKTSGGLLKVICGSFLQLLAWFLHTEGQIIFYLYILYEHTKILSLRLLLRSWLATKHQHIGLIPIFFLYPITPLLLVTSWVQNVKSTHRKLWARNLMEWSDLNFDPPCSRSKGDCHLQKLISLLLLLHFCCTSK